MYCSKCGTENQEEARFCKDCGFHLIVAQVQQQASAKIEFEIRNGLANHYMGIEAVGGKLFLTNQKLRFKSHSINIQVHEMEIPLDQIVRIEKASGLLAFKQINIFLKDGSVEKFVVNNREEWINTIIKQKNQ
jgi:hypothetical protein